MRSLGPGLRHAGRRNPDLVVVSITPFGQTGPYSDWNGYDLNAYHLTGASSRYCGRPARCRSNMAPSRRTITARLPRPPGDWLRSTVGARRTADSISMCPRPKRLPRLSSGGQNIGGYAQDGNFDRRTGVGMPQGAPATIMPCKDGHVWMLALEPGQWNGLRKVMGNPEWADLELFQDMFQRAQNADLIYSVHRGMDDAARQDGDHGEVPGGGLPGDGRAHGRRSGGTAPPRRRATTSSTSIIPYWVPCARWAHRSSCPNRPAARMHPRRCLGSTMPRSNAARRCAAGKVGANCGVAGRSNRTRCRSKTVMANALPLKGIRVINFGWVWAGRSRARPWAFSVPKC
jgi:hypothetical protein